MSTKVVFHGQAVKSELVVMILEKWGLHPQMDELAPSPDPDDMARNTQVAVPLEEYDRAHDILFGESEIERAEF